MKIAHNLAFDPSIRRSISVHFIGLPYLHHALLAWGRSLGIAVTVMDGDTVSPTNCVRQPFRAADIGHNKALLLVNRVNLFHNLDWRSDTRFFNKETQPVTRPYEDGVDRPGHQLRGYAGGRRELHDAFHTHNGPWSDVRYWLNLGNGANSGQFVLGQPRNRVNGKSKTRLRTVTELFPSIMDTSYGEGPLPSCSAAEALDRQEPFINNVLATSALAMVTRLFRYGSTDHHGALYNASSGRTVPMPVDPDLWEKALKHGILLKRLEPAHVRDAQSISFPLEEGNNRRSPSPNDRHPRTRSYSTPTRSTIMLKTMHEAMPKVRDIVAANVQALIDHVAGGHSEKLAVYLAAMGRFHDYSFGNVIEIARQKPVT